MSRQQVDELPNEPTVDSTQVHRVDGRTGTRSRSSWVTGHTPVSSMNSRVTSTRHHTNLSRLQQVERLSRRTSHVFNTTSVDPTTSVDSTTSTTRVPILTFKSWNEVFADGFDDQTVKRIPASCCDTTTYSLSLAFNKYSEDHAFTTDQLTTQSCDNHMMITRAATSRRAQPFQFTEHGLECDFTHKRCAENHCDNSWNMKHQNKPTDQLSHFTYRNLHGFARFPCDSTALVKTCCRCLCWRPTINWTQSPSISQIVGTVLGCCCWTRCCYWLPSHCVASENDVYTPRG